MARASDCFENGDGAVDTYYGPKLKLTKDDWSQLITGEKRFVNLHASLKALDEAIDASQEDRHEERTAIPINR